MKAHDIKGKWESLGDIGFDKAIGKMARIKKESLMRFRDTDKSWWEQEEWSDPEQNLELHDILMVICNIGYGVIGSYVKVYSFKYGRECYLHCVNIEVKS
jgi:hypothetical protein